MSRSTTFARVLHYAGEGAASPASAGVSSAAPPLPPSHTDQSRGGMPAPDPEPAASSPSSNPRAERQPNPNVVPQDLWDPSHPNRNGPRDFAILADAQYRGDPRYRGWDTRSSQVTQAIHGYQDGQSKEWVQNAGRGADPALSMGRTGEARRAWNECGEAPHPRTQHYDARLPAYLCPRSHGQGFNPQKQVNDAVRFHQSKRAAGLRRVEEPGKPVAPRGVRRGYPQRDHKAMEEKRARARHEAFRFFYDHDQKTGAPVPRPRRTYPWSQRTDHTWEIMGHAQMNSSDRPPTPPLPPGAAPRARAAAHQMATGKRMHYKNAHTQPLW
jgi:hypothetical protein